MDDINHVLGSVDCVYQGDPEALNEYLNLQHSFDILEQTLTRDVLGPK